MASPRCLAIGKAIMCACITQSQHSVIPDIFHPEERWWTDPPTHQRSMPFQHTTTRQYPTRNMQSAAWSTATCVAVLSQPSSVMSFVSSDSTTSWRSFQTCQQTWTFVRILTYLHIIINVAWSCSVLYCLQASVSTSHLLRPQSLSAQQPIWTTFTLSNQPGCFAQKLTPPPPKQENALRSRECGVQDSSIHAATPYRLDGLGFKAQCGIPPQNGPEGHPLSYQWVGGGGGLGGQGMMTTHTHLVPWLKKA
jgi:hypothetical protein